MVFDLEKVRAICERVASSLGLELVDVEFRGGTGKQGRLLRIYIDCLPAVDTVPGANASSSDGSAAGNVAETSSPSPSPILASGSGEAGALDFTHALGVTHLGVTHEDCAKFSREVSTILDVEDVVSGGEYLLEVSSPGLDRKLSKPSDYERFTGSRVKIMTIQPVGVTEKSKGNRHFEGRLEKFSNGRLVLDVSPNSKPKRGKSKAQPRGTSGLRQTVEIDWANVERANLVPEL